MAEFIINSSDELTSRIHFALTNGIVMAYGDEDVAVLPAPFSLHPFKYPTTAFETGVQMAPIFNRLVDAIANDSEWLLQTLETTCKHDAFTCRLMAIYKTILADGGPSQSCVLGLHRSDYMQHEAAGDTRVLLQVELNTIASSFGSLSAKISQMHRMLSAANDFTKVPRNDPHYAFADGMAAAHSVYIKQRQLQCSPDAAIVVIVVQPGERNFADQRILEFSLLERHGIVMKRYSLIEIIRRGRIDSARDGAFIIDGKEVSLFYFRAGYSPNDYPTSVEWDARILIEQSKAIKCPNIAYHLVGTKKVQQVLAVPGQLERFLSLNECEHIRQVFAGLFSLDAAETSEVELRNLISKASEAHHKYVLKPQREGGGNNIYNEGIPRAFKDMTKDELKGYILMEKICAPSQTSTLVMKGKPQAANSICEFGVFGVYLHDHADGESAQINCYAGHMLRVKAVGVEEGGVASGYSCLSSPLLI